MKKKTSTITNVTEEADNCPTYIHVVEEMEDIWKGGKRGRRRERARGGVGEGERGWEGV